VSIPPSGCGMERARAWRCSLRPSGIPEGELWHPIFAVAEDWRAQGRHVGAQLMGAARQRIKRQPSETISGTGNGAVEGDGRLARIDYRDALAAAAGNFGQGQIDAPMPGLGDPTTMANKFSWRPCRGTLRRASARQ